jgi:uncharacterized membrane protein YfcA
LILAGVPPISANATNNAAMWVGTLGSARGYKEELREYRALLLPPIVVSLIGALAGSLLLLRTPPTLFERLIPWLLLFAVAVFAASPILTRGVADHDGARVHAPWQLVLQFLVAIYGGYFGAGIGYLMLAILAFSGLPNMNAMNGIKNLLAACINGIALVPFIIARIVDWRFAVLMAIAAVAGGYLGSRLFRRLPSSYTRAGIIVLGSAMTLYFFVKR